MEEVLKDPTKTSIWDDQFPEGEFEGTLTADQELVDEPLPEGFNHKQLRKYEIVKSAGHVSLGIRYQNGLYGLVTGPKHLTKSSWEELLLDSEKTFTIAQDVTAMMPVVVVDIETHAQSVNSEITSAGLCYGDLATGQIYDYTQLHLTERQPFRKMDMSTMEFWQDQNEANPMASTLATLGRGVTTAEFLMALRRYFRYKTDAEVICNGPEFDAANIQSLAEHYSMDMPWQYRRNQSLRTLVYIGRKLLGYDPKRDDALSGAFVKHFAMHDAIHEFQYASLIVRELMRRLNLTVEDLRRLVSAEAPAG